MKHKQAKRIFFNWLKKKNLYAQYKHYRHQTNNDPNAGYHRSYLRDPYRYVIDAFSWGNTIQGRSFWEQIHFEWKGYLNSLECRYH